MHVLFTCQRAQAIWRCLGVWDRIREVIVEDHSGSVILEEILRRNVMLSELNNVGFAELILTGGWYLWWERRQVVHGEAVQSFARSAMSIVVLSQNYINATKKEAREKEGWKRPIEDFVKLNIDGSFNEETGTGATGAIIRDHTGGVVAMGRDTYHMLVMHLWRRLMRCWMGFVLRSKTVATGLSLTRIVCRL